MLIKEMNCDNNTLNEASNFINESQELSDCESNNSAYFVPVVETAMGYQAINLKDIKNLSESTNKSYIDSFYDICSANDVSNPLLYVNEEDFIEDDSLKNIAESLSDYKIAKIAINDNNPVYICAKEALDEYAYTGDSSLLESFMNDDFYDFADVLMEAENADFDMDKASDPVNGLNYAKTLSGEAKKQAYKVALKARSKAPKPETPKMTDEEKAKLKEKSEEESKQMRENPVNPDSEPDSQTSKPQQDQADKQDDQQKDQTDKQEEQQKGQENKQEETQKDQQDKQQEEQKEDQQEKQVENVVNSMEKSAENKPAGFISSKIAALRKLYQNWLAKKNQEHDQGKIGFFSNILRVITNCIDRLLAKLQGAKNAENDTTANNNTAGSSNNNNSTAPSNTNATTPQQQNP